MNTPMPVSVRLYRALTYLYPLEIRDRWESEMADTFALQMADARRSGRRSTVAAVWYYALAELLQIALPRRLARATLVIPVSALTAAGALMFGFMWALLNSLTLKAIFHHTFAKFGG